MLSEKSVGANKPKTKASNKTPAKKSASRTTSASVSTDIPDMKSITREQRLRHERVLFSALLAQSSPPSDMGIVKLVHDRLPVNVVDRFLAEGVTQQEVDKLVAPRRTLTHRRANKERLTVDESDRAVRLARVVAQTESVFDNKDKAMRWLRHPMKRFDGKTPIEMLDTDVGSRLVEEALVQIDEGFFA